jgi:hypothetical protein
MNRGTQKSRLKVPGTLNFVLWHINCVSSVWDLHPFTFVVFRVWCLLIVFWEVCASITMTVEMVLQYIL